MSIKLISVNIEQDKHLDLVKPFIDQEKAEVVMMLECPEDAIAMLTAEYPYYEFLPNFKFADGREMGVAIASKDPLTEVEKFYCDEAQGIPLHGMGTHRPAVIGTTIKEIRIYATHFTWTPAMSETETQHRHLDILLNKLQGEELILVGDFNIPRGNGAYQKLSHRYKDNVPGTVVTTIDPKLHRANLAKNGTLLTVVDYIWSCLPAGRQRPKYAVSKVRVVSGVSDHCGLVCEICLV